MCWKAGQPRPNFHSNEFHLNSTLGHPEPLFLHSKLRNRCQTASSACWMHTPNFLSWQCQIAAYLTASSAVSVCFLLSRKTIDLYTVCILMMLALVFHRTCEKHTKHIRRNAGDNLLRVYTVLYCNSTPSTVFHIQLLPR